MFKILTKEEENSGSSLKIKFLRGARKTMNRGEVKFFCGEIKLNIFMRTKI